MTVKMDYQQVKERVDAEDRALKRIFIETGVGMLAAALIAVFILRI